MRVAALFILVIFVFSLSGCATEYNLATGKEELIFISTSHELRMGRSIARQIEKEYKLLEDELVQARVNEIGQKVAGVCDRKDITYNFKVLDEEDINAFALPGGYIYVFKGTVDKVDSDDELAFVLAHEVGHVAAKHSVKRMQGALGYNIFRILTARTKVGREAGRASDIAFSQIMVGYSRKDELYADKLGVRYIQRAGYDPNQAVVFLKRLREIERKKPIRPPVYIKTHPPISVRIEAVRREFADGITFNDYLGSIGESY